MNRIVWTAAAIVCGAGISGRLAAQQAVADVPAADASRNEVFARQVTVQLDHVALQAAVDAITKNAGVRVQYEIAALRRVATPVSLHASKLALGVALDRVLRGTNLQAVALDRDLVGIEPLGDSVAAGVGVVRGVVVDSTAGTPLAGVAVSLRGTPRKVVTNRDGQFHLRDVPVGDRPLFIQSLGYRPVTHVVHVTEGQAASLRVALVPAATVLSGVVTTATGQQRKFEVGNDITTLNVDSIMQRTPIMSVTDLLEGRVPGLVVQHTSGAPGDPARLRLRGAASIGENNDPIVIVDGVRMYASQSDTRNQNLGAVQYDSVNNRLQPYVVNNIPAVAAPSPLDQLDPNTIETIDVMKGPAAATLYGADAANGVIVITTKRGRPGPTRWSVSGTRGLSYLPGDYPDALWRWGHDITYGTTAICPITSARCVQDSLQRYQALNDPSLTPFTHGASQSVTTSVSGGASTLQYALTGSASNDLGLLKMPNQAAQDYLTRLGTRPPGWMRRPDQYQSADASGRLATQLSPTADLSFTSSLSKTSQQKSGLGNDLALLSRTFIDPVNNTYLQASPVISNGIINIASTSVLSTAAFVKSTDDEFRSLTAATGSWRIQPWFTTGADVGLDVLTRTDKSVLPRGMTVGTPDSIGYVREGHGQSTVQTVNLRGAVSTTLPADVDVTVSGGANYYHNATVDVYGQGTGIAAGKESLTGALTSTSFENSGANATFGYYLEPRFSYHSFFLSTGIRADAGSTYGSGAKLFVMPKINASWVVSEAPFFAPLRDVVSSFRVRAALGEAGVQPGLTDRLRTFQSSTGWLDGSAVSVSQIGTIGNTLLQPERSRELESGFDVDVLDGRMSFSLTSYVKTRTNAITSVTPPPSVDGINVTQQINVGKIRNSGLELTLSVEPIRTRQFTWNGQLTVSRNRNRVVTLGPAVQSFAATSSTDQRIAVGYPLFGIWAKPILAYTDINDDGVIESNEVQVGDSLAYMGAPTPDYESTLHTAVSLFNDQLTVGANVNYSGGLTQVNRAAGTNQVSSRALNDPTTPLAQQAAIVAYGSGASAYGTVQTVSTLRLNELSVAYRIPRTIARYFRTEAMSVALQGRNLGLKTNYAGKDPDVNAFSTGNNIQDPGIMPQPRTWQLRVNLGY